MSRRGARMAGWFLAANALAVLAGTLGAAEGATDAAQRIAWWCGLS
jgi:hypothetical protein